MRIAVFCGSSFGNDEHYAQEAKKLGEYFAKHNIELVYGGGRVGLMGTVADAVMQNGGKVYGVIPTYLQEKELAHEGLTTLYVVKDMHERKAKMAELADAFVALAGGAGTLEEIFEVWTWAQLGHHKKPCAFYNTKGFYDQLFSMINTMSKEGFLKEIHENMLLKVQTPQELLEGIQNYQAPALKW